MYVDLEVRPINRSATVCVKHMEFCKQFSREASLIILMEYPSQILPIFKTKIKR